MSSSTYEAGVRRVDAPVGRIAVSDDPYGEATAEFYDLLATAMWDELGPSLPRLLSGVDPAAGPILDLGAGTGAGTVHLNAAFPSAAIIALEPSKAMRTALNARLAGDADLRRAVTVVPRTFEDARSAAPPQWGAGERRDRPFRSAAVDMRCGRRWPNGSLPARRR